MVRPGTTHGFTIVELVLVIAIGLSILAITLPVGIGFYRITLADEAASELTAALRSAQMNALLGKHGRAHGILISGNSYTIFEGESFATRVPEEDLAHDLPGTAVISGMPSEIVFSRTHAIPSATGTLFLTLFDRTHEVVIRDGGLIEYAE